MKLQSECYDFILNGTKNYDIINIDKEEYNE